jgi:hypothetical protein
MKISICCLLLITPLTAVPRTSGSYTIATDTTDGGGRRSASTSYSADASVGGISAIATVAFPSETVKSGYLGQLYEVTGVQLAAAPTTVNEGSTRQLSSALLLDDLTTLSLSTEAVNWSITSGPLSVNGSGLVTATPVYQNNAAVVTGSYGENTGSLALTVIETIADNFGTYAADGLDDDWQTQFFGENNSNAAPLVDADNDGFNNHFEFTAGLIPTDPLSVFHCKILPATENQYKIIFSPWLPGRTYNVKTSTDLTANGWIPLIGTTSDEGNVRTVMDTDTTTKVKFYRVEITKP